MGKKILLFIAMILLIFLQFHASAVFYGKLELVTVVLLVFYAKMDQTVALPAKSSHQMRITIALLCVKESELQQ